MLSPDGSGGVWAAGETLSTDFPTVGGGNGDPDPDALGSDLFVSHFSAAGTLTFSTYLGGNDFDHLFEFSPDGSGGVWVAGFTDSTDFPTAGGGSGDQGDSSGNAFVSHFTTAGTLTFSTYLGTGPSGAVALAPDSNGGVWVAGGTSSTDFPTQNPFQSTLAGASDAFVSHFTTTGTLTFSTYLGGNRDDDAFALLPDDSGGVWVAGVTLSTDFPTQNPIQPALAGANDAVVSHFSAAGTLMFSTYLGGNGDEPIQGGNRNNFAHDLAPDGSGGAWFAGFTTSTDFPTAGGGSGDPGDGIERDAFVAKISEEEVTDSDGDSIPDEEDKELSINNHNNLVLDQVSRLYAARKHRGGHSTAFF